MKRLIFSVICFCSFLLASAQDRTLRVDYIFSGTDKSQEISLDEMSVFDGWAGRRVNLDQAPVKGNGQIVMTGMETGRILFSQSFSTLFQEWRLCRRALKLPLSTAPLLI